MNNLIHAFRKVGPVIVISFFLAMTGCERTETREKVDDAVETLAGKKNMDQMKEMEKEVEGIQGRQDERLKQLEDRE
jgi:hypothetical protein